MKKLMLIVSLLLVTGFAYADPMEFINWQPGGWQDGYFYQIQDLKNPRSQPIFDVMCDDYAHGGLPGQKWAANFNNLGSGDLSNTRFGQLSNALTLYEEAGWILLQTASQPQTQWGYMNWAVWSIFDPKDLPGNGLNAVSAYWLIQAQKNYASIDPTQVEIITPTDKYSTDPNSAQEFMCIWNTATASCPTKLSTPRGADGTTPEPGTFILLGTGLVGLVGRKLLL